MIGKQVGTVVESQPPKWTKTEPSPLRRAVKSLTLYALRTIGSKQPSAL